MISPGSSLSAVAIVGPTAVGKSDVADRLAARLSSEVLSCDAMQIYRGMDIGTAKMMPEECSAPLRLVDIVDPGVAYSAALYQSDARAHIERLLGEQRLPVFCGGTGLYLKAALDEMDFLRENSRTNAARDIRSLPSALERKHCMPCLPSATPNRLRDSSP